MKRKNLYKLLVVLIVAISCVVAFCLQYFGVVSIDLLWFPQLICTVSIILIFRAVLYHSKSTMWFALVLFMTSITSYFEMNGDISYKWIATISVIIVAISSFLVYIIYMDRRGLLSFMIFVPLVVPSVLYALDIINVWWSVLIMTLFISAVLILIKVSSKIKIKR